MAPEYLKDNNTNQVKRILELLLIVIIIQKGSVVKGKDIYRERNIGFFKVYFHNFVFEEIQCIGCELQVYRIHRLKDLKLLFKQI